ncbi:MAG: zinc ribbon domain-containing protein [bacterium]
MYPLDFPGWAWWNWGWEYAIVVVILLGVFLIPWLLFCLTLQTTLNRVSDRNRAMPAGHVWLNFIPVFYLGWFIYTVVKVRDSVRAEYRSRGWAAEGDFGYNVGVVAGILSIFSFVLGWVPILGWGLAIAAIFCWIFYWLRIADLKNRLGERGLAQGTTAPAAAGPAGQAPSEAGLYSEEKVARQCAACGAGFDPGDRFCRACGLPLPGGRE